MEDVHLDGVHLRVLKKHKHRIAELLAEVCSCHYEEKLCLVNGSPCFVDSHLQTQLERTLENSQH